MFFGCNALTKPKVEEKSDKVFKTNQSDTIVEQVVDYIDTIDYDHEIYYIVIVDSSDNYFDLNKEMYRLHKEFKIEIDTMGRYFNQQKNLICLPDDDEDEIYAGEYFPRRFPSKTLSIEYLNSYQKSSNNTMALIAGIFEDKTSADSLQNQLKNQFNRSFVCKSMIYVGCIH